MNKKSSLFFLSLLCFSLADIYDGLGPFLGVFLQKNGWTPDEIGYVMALGGLIGILCTTPMGAFVDFTHKKRLLIAAASLSIVISSVFIFYCWDFWAVLLSKLIQGIAGAVLPSAVTAVTLGLVGIAFLNKQLGTNEAWNHAGNAATAVLSGIIGYFWGLSGILFILCAMGILALFCLKNIDPRLIDYNNARGLQDNKEAIGNRQLFQNKGLLLISFTLFFFHLGNAALLPLLGQSAVAHFDVEPASYTAFTIIVAQATMIPVAVMSAKLAEKKGYHFLFYLALIVLPIRGILAGTWQNPWNIIPVQILDGVGAGILGVATPGIVAHLLKGTGHINLGLGFALTIQSIGASLSNGYGGAIAHYLGYGQAFIGLAAAPLFGLALFFFGERKKLL